MQSTIPLLGTLMRMPGELHLNVHGRWVHDGVTVTHQGIADYLSKHLRWSDEHEAFVVEVDGRAVRVHIDDTPYFVTALAMERVPWQITLNDGSSTELRTPIEVRPNGEFICRVKEGRFLAKISRSIHQQLQPFIVAVPGKESDRYVVETPSGQIELICRNLPRAD